MLLDLFYQDEPIINFLGLLIFSIRQKVSLQDPAMTYIFGIVYSRFFPCLWKKFIALQGGLY